MTFETNTFTGTSQIAYPGSYPDYHLLSCADCGAPLPSGTGDEDLTCTYCGQHHRFLSPPLEKRAANFSIGDRVAVEWGGRWWSAHVVQVISTQSMWKIHFDGWAPAFDDLVDASRIRAVDDPLEIPMAPASTKSEPLRMTRQYSLTEILGILAMILGMGLAAFGVLYHPVRHPVSAQQVEAVALGTVTGPISTHPVTVSTPLEAGQKFHVRWGKDWYLGTATYVHPATGEVLIRYDGWQTGQDEVVPRERLRLVKE